MQQRRLRIMRILHIGSGNLFGGVETMLLTMARQRELCPEMEPVFSVCFEGRFSAELEASGVTVHRTGAVQLRNPMSVWRARRRLLEVIRSGHFDAAICHSAWTHAIFAPVLAQAGTPNIFWLHGEARQFNWLERAAARYRPAYVICNSRFTAASLPKLFPGVPASVVYCPVDQRKTELTPAQRTGLRQGLGASPDTVVILQASRMEEGKGYRQHVAALVALRELPNWTCWLAGGAQRPREKALEADLHTEIDRARLTGRVHFLGERSDVGDLMAAADLFCQPTTSPETFGITFVEALRAGIPVIASSHGGALEIVDADCGLLVPPGEVSALSKTLARYLAEPLLRAVTRTAGPARATELCSPKRQIQTVHSILTTVIEHRKAA